MMGGWLVYPVRFDGFYEKEPFQQKEKENEHALEHGKGDFHNEPNTEQRCKAENLEI